MEHKKVARAWRPWKALCDMQTNPWTAENGSVDGKGQCSVFRAAVQTHMIVWWWQPLRAARPRRWACYSSRLSGLPVTMPAFPSIFFCTRYTHDEGVECSVRRFGFSLPGAVLQRRRRPTDRLAHPH